MASCSSTIRSSSSKRKKLPPIGYKINRSVNPDEENAEIHSILLEQKELLLEKKVEIDKLLISAEWDSEINEAKVVKNSGSSLSVFGHSQNRCVYLYPEEALFLIEMNKMQLFYHGVRTSIQRAYALLLNSVTKVTIDRYRVFKRFVVHGYKLYRHKESCTNKVENVSASVKDSETNVPNNILEECYKKLRIFSPVISNDVTDAAGLSIMYDVYSPQTVLQKSCRPEPDYYLAIIRCEEKIDSLFQMISSLKYTNILFAHISGNTISIFNMQGVQIPNLF